MIKNKLFGSAKLRLLAVLAALILVITGLLLIPISSLVAQDMPLPIAPPDAEAGLAIYTERCVVCHGEMGDGQGAQALQAGLTPATVADSAFRVTAVRDNMEGYFTLGVKSFAGRFSGP